MGLLKAVEWRLGQTTAAVFLHFYTDLLGRGGRGLCRLARALLDLALTAVSQGFADLTFLPCGSLTSLFMTAVGQGVADLSVNNLVDYRPHYL